MKITILTLFPEMFLGILDNSIIKRAIAKGSAKVELVNIRDFTKNKYGRVDTPPIGGGAGLVMQVQPIVDALRSIEEAIKYYFHREERNLIKQKRTLFHKRPYYFNMWPL